jgi:soluble lytic murein transglycosylase-like protein
MLFTQISALFIGARIFLMPVDVIKTPKGQKSYVSLAEYEEISLIPTLGEVNTPDRGIDDTMKADPAAPRAEGAKTWSKTSLTLSSGELDVMFNKYGEKYGVSPLLLREIAACESSFNPRAVNGPYAGLFQFCTSTWVSNRQAMGLNPDPELRFNAEEAIKTTAYKISRDGTGAWPVCGS